MLLSDAEWKVMNAVWAGSPASVRDVLERLEGESSWAYTTIKTMMSRLTEKGALSERKRANVSLYEPLVTRGQARREAVRSLLDKAFDGAFGSFMAFLVEEERLSEADQERLREMMKGED